MSASSANPVLAVDIGGANLRLGLINPAILKASWR